MFSFLFVIYKIVLKQRGIENLLRIYNLYLIFSVSSSNAIKLLISFKKLNDVYFSNISEIFVFLFEFSFGFLSSNTF